MSKQKYVIGIDVGGTFTDLVCADGENSWSAKSPTDPAEFGAGVLRGCELVAEKIGISITELLNNTHRFGLGTTAVTNVLAERKGATVGLLTTKGFEESVLRARGRRVSEDGWLAVPWAPVEFSQIAGIDERTDRNGDVLKEVDADEVKQAVDHLVTNENVDALAISFLWSFKNSDNETKAAEIVKQLYPDIPVFTGAELHPVMREYERTSTATLSAYACRALDGVEDLRSKLKEKGLKVPILLLHSGGGTTTVEEARKNPLSLAASGPAAGVVAASDVGQIVGMNNLLTCDMGGTSIDVALVRESNLDRSHNAEICGIVTGQSTVDVESIGAGGGSIAWVDKRGALRVGPESARANPGPVCYGRGGTQPTVTDAMVVLGFIDPASFKAGGLDLDVEGAKAACGKLGESIGLSAIEVAVGIRAIALAEMEKAFRARIATAGIDSRQFTAVAFGGSGSLFTPEIAQSLGLDGFVTPHFASVLSAYGAATADMRREIVKSIDKVVPTGMDWSSEIKALKTELEYMLDQMGVAPEDRDYLFEVDIRLHRQHSFVTLSVGSDLNEEEVCQRFRTKYSELYGPAALMPSTVVEISTLRGIGVGRTIRASLANASEQERPSDAPISKRDVWLASDGATQVDIFSTEQVQSGVEVEGPSIVQGNDTSIWVPPGMLVQGTNGGTIVGIVAESQ